MARISFSEIGKRLEEAVHFSFGNESFDLDQDGTHETDDATVIAEARNHPYLEVEQNVEAETTSAEEEARRVAESDDPHVNRKADHLSSEASPEAIEAARARAEAIQEEVQANAPAQQAQDSRPEQATKESSATSASTGRSVLDVSAPDATTKESTT